MPISPKDTFDFALKRAVLFEASEFAFHSIEAELQILKAQDNLECQVIPILGTVLDFDRIQHAFQRFNIHTVYHAAADLSPKH